MRDAIPATQRLSITLRYLATGSSFEDGILKCCIPSKYWHNCDGDLFPILFLIR
jgi:hypothetical protein